jgi:hypothetical protein
MVRLQLRMPPLNTDPHIVDLVPQESAKTAQWAAESSLSAMSHSWASLETAMFQHLAGFKTSFVPTLIRRSVKSRLCTPAIGAYLSGASYPTIATPELILFMASLSY